MNLAILFCVQYYLKAYLLGRCRAFRLSKEEESRFTNRTSPVNEVANHGRNLGGQKGTGRSPLLPS